ncbi:hypothetical protein HPB50_008207 [Hyalomma asiaticum]|uniref:Uncharacterized protein n=1 Tax=Hyalomma asiaticum TaxID=266040 RepID=A0ACB7SD48_HYAAI|nr:hypothetical protein HPB50_008207 [Hyalomma asiaticum]
MIYACVRYVQDGERAVLPTNLIKNFKPSSAKDIKGNEVFSTYWVDEDGECENFYLENVTALGAVLLRVLHLLMQVRQQNRDTMQELCLLRNEVQLPSQRLGQAEAADRSLSLPQAQPSVVLPRLSAETISELEAAEAAVQNEAVASALFYADAICQKANVDLCTTRDFIKRWLPGSIDRSGGRKRRFAEALMAKQPHDPCPRSRDPEGRDHQQPTTAAFLASRCHQRPGQTTSGANPPHSAPPPSASFPLQPQPI